MRIQSRVVTTGLLLGLLTAAPSGGAELKVVGDGVTDNTAALQEHIDAGGTVLLTKGVYRISRPIVIDLDKTGRCAIRGDGMAKLVMAGPGPALSFIGTHRKNADPGGFEDRVWQRQFMPGVFDLALEGAHPEAGGVAAVGTMQLTVSRCHFHRLLHGIHLHEHNRNVLISDCHIYEIAGIGIWYDNVDLHQSNIVGSHISYCKMGGIVARQGNVRNIHITGCDIESCMDPKTPATANILIDCRDSKYGTAEVAITGCTIQHNSPSPDSANIRIIGRSLPSKTLEVVQEGNITITGNVLSDVQVNVHLVDCRGVTLQGNTFWMGYQRDLLVENCSNIVMGPNNLDRNPRYDYGTAKKALGGVLIKNSVDCTITGLHITQTLQPAGLHLIDCKRMNIVGCTILDCDNVGLLLERVSHSRVSSCLIRDDRPAAKSATIKDEQGQGNRIQAD